MNVSSSEALIALNAAPNIGPAAVRRLVSAFGSPEAAIAASEDELECALKSPRLAQTLAEFLAEKPWENELETARKKNVKIVTLCDADYPRALREIDDAPVVLYVFGNIKCCENTCVGIVGTRFLSVYGRETARSFGYQLANLGFTVVSGLARGIDTEAHSGAVEAKGKTVAVLGGALDELFPKENRELAINIVKCGGAIVSEYPFGRKPDKTTFPQRNRIISGLSAGVLVIEAPEKSGALITTDYAKLQGRKIMAVPGHITSENSKGCHKLIQAGATLVGGIDDIVDAVSELPLKSFYAPAADSETHAQFSAELPLERADAPKPPTNKKSAAKKKLPALEGIEKQVFEALGDDYELLDDIAARAEISISELRVALLALEMKLLAEQLPSGYVKKRK